MLLPISLGACGTSSSNAVNVTANSGNDVGHKKNEVSSKQSMNRDEKVDYAKGDLAKRLEVENSAVSLLSVKLVTWRSGALGCPVIGEVYTQALEPGVLIVLSVDNKPYRYHSDLDGSPFYCPDARVEAFAANTSDM